LINGYLVLFLRKKFPKDSEYDIINNHIPIEDVIFLNIIDAEITTLKREALFLFFYVSFCKMFL